MGWAEQSRAPGLVTHTVTPICATEELGEPWRNIGPQNFFETGFRLRLCEGGSVFTEVGRCTGNHKERARGRGSLDLVASDPQGAQFGGDKGRR